MDKYERRWLALRGLVSALGHGGISEISARTGIDASYVSRMCYPEGKRGRKRIGEGSWDKLVDAFPELEEQAANKISKVAEIETDSDYVHFPLVEGFVAAGEEGYMPDYPEVVKDLKVAREWVERNLPAKPANIRVLTVQGDSMSPEINSGDVLFIDVSVTHFVTDAIYVMNYAGRPMVKRLQARRDGSVLIKSTNESYDPETVPASELHELYVSGRVIGVWRFSRA